MLVTSCDARESRSLMCVNSFENSVRALLYARASCGHACGMGCPQLTGATIDPSCGDGRFIAAYSNSVGIEQDPDSDRSEQQSAWGTILLFRIYYLVHCRV